MQTYVCLFINLSHYVLLNMCLHICSPIHICAAECDNLPDPPFGGVSLSGNSIGDVATYVCEPAFELVGQPTRTCEQLNDQTADWSGEEPVCRRMYAFSLILFTLCVTKYVSTYLFSHPYLCS